LYVRVYTISADKIIAIPSLEDYPISKRAEFQSDEVVLAIYPETSVFYHARVVQGPKKVISVDLIFGYRLILLLAKSQTLYLNF
jgi:hypothetical protein